ncbi:zinc-binding dehydrogenase [Candidatus Solirubrobacter pratensis]|uniref:zinc-binding dehydrogenase n=1 Tax=Candidatus Solirubrobacter pratensis TaxID=1298857 RepID=UPI0003FFA464|nr:zinc-binding dehydrogenase [Candidatus Solirubrobacter pratensis]
MHAIRLHEFGPAENLRYEELPDPAAGEGQVRIAVEAAGVHLIDTSIRAGRSGGPFPLPDLPMIPGREVAGTVGSRRVAAHLGMASGGYAELAIAPEAALHDIPAGLAADVAVAAIGTGRTAIGVLEVADLQPDDVVLVTAAAGGLGGLFLQAARNAGAFSIGAAGGEEKTARIDADLAVDYSRPDWTERLREHRVTVVLDGVGGALGRAALELLAPGGRIILFGFASGAPTEITTADLYRLGIRADAAIGPRMTQRPGGLRELETAALEAAATGRLVPIVGEAFALADAAAAHRALESRATVGKVVLIP